MWLSPIFERFVNKSPITIIVRALMEVVLAPEKLDDLFEKTAQTGYTRDLLFSTLVKMMTQVVCSVRQSIGVVYKAMSAEIGVSKTAVYDKLNRLEPSVSKALVKSTAIDLATILHQLGGEQPELLPGYRVKILDGNGLGATEHRLEVLLNTPSGPLPGKSLVVLDPALGLATDIFPCEDGHAQERSLLPEVLETVEAGELWIGDRNFCTTELLFSIESKQAFFLVRQHQNLPWIAASELVWVGHTDGGKVFEQTGVVSYEGHSCCCRRVVVQLDRPTRNGETQIALLTNLPETDAPSVLVAQLYRKRWKVETLFQVATEIFHCEIKTLGYPRAALFSFCMALVAYNLFSTLKGVLASVHGRDCREKLSYYYLGEELDATYQGMMIALPPEDWQDLATMSLPQFSSLLQDWAQFVKLEAFTSAPRKPKKKKPKPPYDPRHPHVSTARLLAQKKKSRASPNK
ncbi:MAG: IS4 family transposase [Pleurocapsa sp. MO_192.B19]|nr:IS4 family transposase [Pleurocapsa sp. MO_192.B19]